MQRGHVDKQEAFLEFKQLDEAKDLEESIRDNRTALKEMKVSVRDLTEKCNVSKKSIDTVKVDLDRKQDERRQNQNMGGIDEEDVQEEDGGQEIIDEDELALLTHMKELKKAYRASYTDLKNIKSQVSQVN